MPTGFNNWEDRGVKPRSLEILDMTRADVSRIAGRSIPLRKRFAKVFPSLVLGIGLAGSAAAWFVVSTTAQQRAEREFFAQAETQRSILQNGFADQLEQL